MIKRAQILELTDGAPFGSPAPCKFIVPGTHPGAAMTLVTDRDCIHFTQDEMDAIFMLLKDVYYG